MAATNSAAAPAPAKSKKLIVIGALVALLVVAVAAVLLVMTNKSQGDVYGEDAPAKTASPGSHFPATGEYGGEFGRPGR